MRSYNVGSILARLGVRPVRSLGRQVVARCPSGVHDDADPSWRIVTAGDKAGQHYCDACQFGGGVLDLVAHVLKIPDLDEFGNQDERARWRRAQEWVEEGGDSGAAAEAPGVVRLVASPAREVGFRLPAEVVVEPVDRWPAPARDYLLGRGVTEEQAARWRFGYAVDGRLRDRVVFVVRDGAGRPVTYTARSYVDADPRYKTPEAWERADRAATFGAEHWPAPEWSDERGAFCRDGPVWGAEGVLKVLAVERVVRAREGRWPAVAAILGARVHARHALGLGTFARLVYVADPGRAGGEAWEALRASQGSREVPRCVMMPAGYDADSIGDDNLARILWRRKRTA